MKGLKIAGIAALAVIAILIVLILAQPTQAHVEKSIVINGPASSISEEIGGFKSFDAWSPWNKISPEMKYTIVTFEGFGGTFVSDIKLEPDGVNTKVKWIYDGTNDGLKGKGHMDVIERKNGGSVYCRVGSEKKTDRKQGHVNQIGYTFRFDRCEVTLPRPG